MIIVLYFYKGWHRLPFFETPVQQDTTPVSIIVAARNEEENIAKTIEDILAQNYDPALMEVIFIDDHSTDQTAAIIARYPRVKLIRLNAGTTVNSYKKKAIDTAIAGASGKLIITTDADCSMGPKWLKTIVSYYEAMIIK